MQYCTVSSSRVFFSSKVRYEQDIFWYHSNNRAGSPAHAGRIGHAQTVIEPIDAPAPQPHQT